MFSTFDSDFVLNVICSYFTFKFYICMVLSRPVFKVSFGHWAFWCGCSTVSSPILSQMHFLIFTRIWSSLQWAAVSVLRFVCFGKPCFRSFSYLERSYLWLFMRIIFWSVFGIQCVFYGKFATVVYCIHLLSAAALSLSSYGFHMVLWILVRNICRACNAGFWYGWVIFCGSEQRNPQYHFTAALPVNVYCILSGGGLSFHRSGCQVEFSSYLGCM